MKNKYVLHGHYPVTPKEYFTKMSEYVSDDESHDQYGNGNELKEFEKEIAQLFNKEDCLFLQSGTMAQQIALRIWTDIKENKNVAFHPKCHLEIHEHMSYSVLHNLNSELIGEKDKLFSIEDLKSLSSKPSVLLFELPQREIGGQLPAWSDLVEQINYLKSQNIIVHLDGARIWECTTYYKKSLKEIAELFDSAYISFYKGIGAIAGAALLGNKDFINEAKIWNRRHGGNLVKSSPYYISARYNLGKRINSFESYFLKTQEIYSLVSEIKEIKIVPEAPQANMFHLYIKNSKETLLKKAMQACKELGIDYFPSIQTVTDELCKLEWYVGDATLDVPLEVINKFLNYLAKEDF